MAQQGIRFTRAMSDFAVYTSLRTLYLVGLIRRDQQHRFLRGLVASKTYQRLRDDVRFGQLLHIAKAKTTFHLALSTWPTANRRYTSEDRRVGKECVST